MFISPKPIGARTLAPEVLAADRKSCRRIGSCGIGEAALYLGGLVFERSWYAPFSDIERVFKRMKVGRGGFTGRGLFTGSLVSVVVRCRGGEERQCGFRLAREADRFLEELGRVRPDLPLRTAESEQALREAKAAEAALYAGEISVGAKVLCRDLEQAKRRLEDEVPALCRRLAEAARRLRAADAARPGGRVFPLAVLTFAAFLIAAGLTALSSGHPSWPYLLLFGAAFALMLWTSGALRDPRRSRPAALKTWEEAEAAMAGYLADDPFPLPPRYAHPLVLARMIRVARQGRAENADEALAAVKTDLQALHAGVTVPQAEYDEVVVVKPMFLVSDYR